MRPIFGSNTRQVLTFLTELWLLSPEEINRVTRAWRAASDVERAEAWAQLHRASSRRERNSYLAAASVARRQAMDVASMLQRADWAFWAAASDAAAAIAGAERLGNHYDILISPLATVLPSLSGSGNALQVPAQRTKRQAAAKREAASRGKVTEPSAKQGAHRGQRADVEAR
jgi:hypothetical protein